LQISLKHGWVIAKHEDAHQQRDASKDYKPDLSLPGTGLVVRFSSSFIPPYHDILTMIPGKKGQKPLKICHFHPKNAHFTIGTKIAANRQILFWNHSDVNDHRLFQLRLAAGLYVCDRDAICDDDIQQHSHLKRQHLGEHFRQCACPLQCLDTCHRGQSDQRLRHWYESI
jgi:hypothetical protein